MKLTDCMYVNGFAIKIYNQGKKNGDRNLSNFADVVNQIQERISLKTQADAIIYFLRRMDIDMVNDILDDNRTYQDFDKALFIHKLSNAFDEFIEAGDTILNCYRGFCNGEQCNYKCSGIAFVGNYSKNYMDLIIDIKNGVVQDIYECAIFNCLAPGIERNMRIFIDKLEPF